MFGPSDSPGTSRQEPCSDAAVIMDYIVCQEDVICWHLDKMPFTKEVAKRAEEELNERPEVTAKAIETLKQMIIDRGEFTSRMDDIFLLRYLRVRKFDFKRAYRLLRNYFTAIIRYPLIFGDPDPNSIKEYIFQPALTILPYRDPNGRVIALLKIRELDVGKTPFNTVILLGAMCVEAIMDDPVTQVQGIVCIADLSHVGMRLLSHVATPSNLYKLFVLLQDCLPGRLKKIHVVFGSKIFQISYNLVKIFMNEKLRNRVIFHGEDMNSLHKHIPPEILPEDYGGTFQLDTSIWAERLMSLKQKFIDAVSYGLINSQH